MFDDNNVDLSSLGTPPSDGEGDGAISVPLASITTTVIEAAGSTSLMQVDNNFFLDPVSGGSGPQLKFGGAAVTDGEFGAWAPIGAEQVGNGYRVAWQFGSADQYQVWNVDGSGNYLSSGATMSGGSYLMESAETLFLQDLNGDGTTGLVTSTIESIGAAVLAQVADIYTVNGSMLKLFGDVVAVGRFDGWAPIAAEPVAGGYQVAWKLAGASQYNIWITDSSGNYLGDVGSAAAGSYKLTSREVGFQQDLNSDGLIGAPTTVLETFGSVRLTQVADTYLLYLGGAGPQLNIGGTAVTVGQFGGWAPVGAEIVNGTYQVAWKLASTDQYKVWTANANGTYLGDTGTVAAGSYRLTSREPGLLQDVNGDGLIGSPVTVLETFGAVRLTQVADTYFLYVNGVGPQLNAGGTEVTTGQFGSWTPIGAEQMLGGYRVAWKFGSADQYTVWTVNGNGGYVGDIGTVTGSSVALRSLEPALSQDLNGDGSTASSSVIEANGAVRLTQVLGTYFLNTAGGQWGPQVSMSVSAVTAGQFGGWTPIGAEASGSNYLVAWKQGADQYTIWTTNAQGGYLANTPVLSGSSQDLQSLEPLFAQDLNGNGTIGVTRFDITVRYSGNSAYQSYFDQAARRWEQIITADLPDVVSSTYGFIDDLMIDASVVFIDGPNRVLGQAGPNAFRSGSNLPTHGIMQFDSADINSMVSQGTFGDVVLHEMGHVLGIGTLWSTMGLKPTFTTYGGAGAVEAFRQLSGNPGAGTVPLESTGGSGTAGVHWSDSVFGNELMTGFISGRPNPLSIMTIGALRDLGYSVNYGAADPYTMPGHLESGASAASIDLSGLIAANVDPASAWQGLVGGLAAEFSLSLVDEDEDEDEEEEDSLNLA